MSARDRFVALLGLLLFSSVCTVSIASDRVDRAWQPTPIQDVDRLGAPNRASSRESFLETRDGDGNPCRSQACVLIAQAGGCMRMNVMHQQEARDPAGRIVVEASQIHVMNCNGRELFIYQYLNRPGFRVISPPHWGNAIGGRDFGSFAEAQSVATQFSTGAGPTPGRPPPRPSSNCPPGSIELLGVCTPP